MAHMLTDIACPACGNRLTKKEALAIYSQVHVQASRLFLQVCITTKYAPPWGPAPRHAVKQKQPNNGG